ncbi:MAG: Glycerate 3-kinase [Phycisphaerae bacterium]|nr:Glycerate 3-kinase [Phycisphaerae bacterium]
MILVAPDKFKGSLSAAEAAAAMADGVRDACADAAVDVCPLADGGEGSGEILAAALGARRREVEALDALGRPRVAAWWLEAGTSTAIVEFAQIAPMVRGATVQDVLRATSYGVGQVLAAAAGAGARHVLLCCGGSGSVDGGAGCLQALGFEFIDRDGRRIDVPLGGEGLARVAGVQAPAAHVDVAIDVLCDVDNPLCGERGAAPVFAPQKGATAPEAVDALARNLTTWAGLAKRITGIRIADVAHGGAAGGVPAGLHAFTGARLLSGCEAIARAVRLEERMAAARLCLTGEGRLDAQTAGGKVVAGVARVARARGVPVVAFAGQVDGDAAVGEPLGLRAAIAISPAELDHASALARAAQLLRAAVGDYLRTVG